MDRVFRTLPDGSTIVFGRGRIDDWCVYIIDSSGRNAPSDIQYFDYLNNLAQAHGTNSVYNDFVQLWDAATSTPDPSVNNLIDSLVSVHPVSMVDDSRMWYTVLYMAMVSEENYPNTKLGKRLKRLGVHQFLLEGMSPKDAANFSRKMKWGDIAAECQSRGF
jgi:hypothetical protein